MKKYEIIENPPGTFTVTVYDGSKPGEPMGGLFKVAMEQFATLDGAQQWIKDKYPDAGQLMRN